MFASANQPLPPAPVESGSVMMIRNLLVDSDFLTLLSPDQVAVELEAGWLQSIAPAPIEHSRTIGVTTRASWRPTTVQADFLADLEAVASNE
jgi:DNA-binding transcriptional LysR family regulator